jgi:chromosome segregation ATPase
VIALPPLAGIESGSKEDRIMSEDLTQKLPTSPDPALAQILSAVQDLGTKVGSLENRLGSLENRFGNLETRMDSLEKKVDERLHDTRPIWEKVQADIAQLHEGQESMRKDVREVRTELRDMNRKLSIFNDNLVQIQADYRDIYDRVRDLERQHP